MGDTMSDIQAMLDVIRRQWKLVIALMLLMIGLAAAVTFSMKTVYTASALVLVDPSRKNLLDPQAGMVTSISDSARVESEVELAASDTVLMRVIEDLGLVENSEFSPRLGLRDQLMIFFRLADPGLPSGEAALNEVLSALRQNVSVDRRGLTFLLSVQARSGDPARAAEIANAVAENYIREQLDSKVDSILIAQEALNARIVEAQQNIVRADDAFDSYMDANIQRIEAESDNGTIAALRGEIEQLEAIRQRSETTAQLVAEQVARRDWQATASQLASRALQDLERQRAELAARIADPAAPAAAAVDLRAELARVESQLETATQSELGQLRQTIADNRQQTEALRQQIRSEVLGSDLSSQVLTEFYGLQQRGQLARTQYETLLARSQDLDAQASLQLADSRIISPALPPSTPSAPNIRNNLLFGALAGLAIGLALAFLYEHYIGGFTSESQAESLLKVPLVAAIPKLRRPLPDSHSVADMLSRAPLSAFSESIRRIMVGVEQALNVSPDTRRPIVLMVSSALPDEGKSSTALALARAYANAGKSTLLIDGDLRKPSLHRLVGLQPERGLLDFLREPAPAFENDVVHRDPLSDAVLLLGARRSTVPTHQIVSDKGFGHVIQAARQSFEVIVIDTSPLSPVVDGLHIARLANAIIYVVRWGKTRQQEARKALTALQKAAPNKPVLLVLNQQEISASTYIQRYGSYYAEPEN